MKKYLLLFILPLLLITKHVIASTTSSRGASYCGVLNNWTDCINSFDLLPNTYATAIGSSKSLYNYGFGFNIPSYSIIESVDITIDNKASGSGGTPDIRQLIAGLYREDNPSLFGNLTSGSCVTNATISPSNSDTTTTINIPVSCYSSHVIDHADINSPNFGIKFITSTNGSPTYSIKDIKISVNYSLTGSGFSMSVDSSTASPSGQYVLLNLSGETATISTDLQCKYSIHERCSRAGFAGYTSTTPVARIFLDTLNNATETIARGSGEWLGHDWTMPSDKTWVAENVKVPYRAGWSCDYPYSYYCSIDHEVVYENNFLIDQSLVATPSATNPETPEISDVPNVITQPFQWLMYQLKQFFIWFFGIDTTINEAYLYSLQGEITTRFPFGYIAPLSTIDWGQEIGTPSAYLPINISFTPKRVINGVTTDLDPVTLNIGEDEMATVVRPNISSLANKIRDTMMLLIGISFGAWMAGAVKQFFSKF